MAEQILTIQPGTLDQDLSNVKRWDFDGSEAIELGAAFITGATGYLRRLRIEAIDIGGVDAVEIRLFIGTSGTASVTADGDDLVEVLETFARAFGYEQGADNGDIPGPDHPGNDRLDATERYTWNPDAISGAAAHTFFFTTLDTGEDWTLRLRTPETNREAAFSARAGNPTAAFGAAAVPGAAAREAAFSARAGNPTAAFGAAAVVLPGPAEPASPSPADRGSGMNATTGGPLAGIEHLRQSIGILLSTPLGTRGGLPEYGSRVWDLLDSPALDDRLPEIYAATAEAIDRWEPRIVPTNIAARVGDDGTVTVDITGLVYGLDGLQTVSVPIQTSP